MTKKKIIGVTQRVDFVSPHDEYRDALDQRLINWVSQAGCIAVPIPNTLFDKSLQGIHRTDKPAFSFQGHPEASPGPNDAAPLFDHFIDLMQQSE